MTTDTDLTESLRRERLAALNCVPTDRATLEKQHGQVWDPGELKRDFIVLGFLAPYVEARRRTDSVVGSLEFQHHPRFYFNWEVDEQQTDNEENAHGRPMSPGDDAAA